jgi:methyltransferase-like protein
VLVFILKTKMTTIAMNVLLHQLQEIVPAFNVASVPKDATGSHASPVHIIAGLLDKTPTYIQKIINGICSNVNANCTKMKVNEVKSLAINYSKAE